MVYRCECKIKCKLYVDAISEHEAELMAYDYLDECELLDAECKCVVD